MNHSKDGQPHPDQPNSDRLPRADWESSILTALSVRNQTLALLAILSLVGALVSLRIRQSREQALSQSEVRWTPDWYLDLNQATQEELQLVPGLGDSLIQAILQRRQELGRFDSLDQLTSISGIKEQRLRSLSRYLKILNPHPDSDDQ